MVLRCCGLARSKAGCFNAYVCLACRRPASTRGVFASLVVQNACGCWSAAGMSSSYLCGTISSVWVSFISSCSPELKPVWRAEGGTTGMGWERGRKRGSGAVVWERHSWEMRNASPPRPIPLPYTHTHTRTHDPRLYILPSGKTVLEVLKGVGGVGRVKGKEKHGEGDR